MDTAECTTQYGTPTIRNRKADPGWISYSRMGAFYSKFSLLTFEFIASLYISACLSYIVARFLSTVIGGAYIIYQTGAPEISILLLLSNLVFYDASTTMGPIPCKFKGPNTS